MSRDKNSGTILKRIVSGDWFGFWWHVWLVLGINRGRTVFLIFLLLHWFYNAKSVFLAVNASLRWLNNFSGVYLVQIFLLLIGPQGPCFPLAGVLCKFYANAGGKRPIQRQHLLVQYKKQATPLLSVNYISLTGRKTLLAFYHEIDFKNVDKNVQNLAKLRNAAGFWIFGGSDDFIMQKVYI